jgi:hypothetical protein
MPNWCYNRLTVKAKSAEALSEFLAAVKKEDKVLSLDAIRPMPAELRGIHTGGCNIDGKYVNRWRVDTSGKEVEITDKELAAISERCDGFSDWYEWSIANWGCKWDVDAELSKKTARTATFTFDSAWCPPLAAVRYAAEVRFPGLAFTIKYNEPGCDLRGHEIFECETAEV